MISAKEARQLILESQNANSKTVLKEIENAIEKEIKKEKSECFYYQNIPEIVLKELKRLEYIVKNESSQKDGIIYRISW